jgi:paraquat-inducible protein A
MARVACLECDLLVDLPPLAPGHRAACPRCHTVVAASPRDGLRRALAYALAAAVMLLLANTHEFLAFKASGLERVMTLPESAGALYDDGSRLLAALVLTFIVIAPAVLTGCLIVLLVPLLNGWRSPWLRHIGRLVFVIGPWSMAEVFLIGVLVSFVKIAKIATMVLGVSFWAFFAFTICLTAARAALDRHYVWSAIEELTP